MVLEQQILSNKEKTIKRTSVVLNIIWVILFIPSVPVAFLAGFRDPVGAGVYSKMFDNLMMAYDYLFLFLPVAIAVTVATSFYLRKKERFMQSIWIQLLPLMVILSIIVIYKLLLGQMRIS